MTEEAAATPQAAEAKGKRGVGRTQGLGAAARTLQWDPGLPASGTRLPRGPGAQRRPPGAGTRSPRAGDSGPGCKAISGGADAVGHRKQMGRWRPWPSSHFAVSEGAAGRAELGCAELGAQLHGAGCRAGRGAGCRAGRGAGRRAGRGAGRRAGRQHTCHLRPEGTGERQPQWGAAGGRGQQKKLPRLQSTCFWFFHSFPQLALTSTWLHVHRNFLEKKFVT